MNSAIRCDARWAGCWGDAAVVTKYRQGSGVVGVQALCEGCRSLIDASYVRGDYWISTRAKHAVLAKASRLGR